MHVVVNLNYIVARANMHVVVNLNYIVVQARMQSNRQASDSSTCYHIGLTAQTSIHQIATCLIEHVHAVLPDNYRDSNPTDWSVFNTEI